MKNALILLSIVILSSCSYNKSELPEPIMENTNMNNAPIKIIVNALASDLFSPANITISVGDTVEWRNSTGFHNINGTQVTYPSNPDSFGNAVSTGWTYTYVFNVSGNYDYQCDVHVASGMVGTITVQ